MFWPVEKQKFSCRPSFFQARRALATQSAVGIKHAFEPGPNSAKSADSAHLMPQIDFGQALSTPDDGKPSQPDISQPLAFTHTAGPIKEVDPQKFRRLRLGRSEWANTILAVIVILGGLFCVCYFFNGAELLRAAARWPREFLYSQPSPGEQDIERFQLAASLGLPSPVVSAKSNDHSGDPFPRATAPLAALNPPNAGFGRVSAAFAHSSGTPDPGALLSQLGVPAPGGDRLLKAVGGQH